ncbi:MAG: DNA polymerase III subunit gamma/tau [Candidatus Omnitrophota bacterium]
MSYLAFARKYRPQSFEELIGQDHIARTLRNAIRKERVAHAYLFAGPRGVGKTSVARIFSKSLNCEKGPTETPCNKCIACQEITQGISLDVLEIDGASNRGIDQIRELRENVKYYPSRGSFRIYIIDEVHQITHDGFDALLKTLEEPPPHVKFILATTEPHKVPATIMSRCQRFDFHRIPSKTIAEKLKAIVAQEKVDVKEEALMAIARSAQGSMRDAESLLDQLSCGPKAHVALEEVLGALGWVGQDFLLRVGEAIQKKEKLVLLEKVDGLVNEGRDLVQFVDELLGHFRNLAVAKLGEEGKRLMDLAEDAAFAVYRQAEGFSLEELLYILNLLSTTRYLMKRSSLPRIPLEIALVKLAKRDSMINLEELVERLEELEKRLASSEGGCQVNPSAASVSREKETQNRDAEPARPVIQPIVIEGKDLSLEVIRAQWEALVERVEAKKKSVGIFFKEGKPVRFQNGHLTVGFLPRNNFHREALDAQSHRTLIEEILSDALKEKIHIVFEALKEEQPSDPPQSPHEDPIVKFTLDVFRGNVVKDE